MDVGYYRQQLESVNRAIEAIESGAQEYHIGSRSLRRGDLATLYLQRDRLEGLIADAEGRSVTYAFVSRRR